MTQQGDSFRPDIWMAARRAAYDVGDAYGLSDEAKYDLAQRIERVVLNALEQRTKAMTPPSIVERLTDDAAPKSRSGSLPEGEK